MNWKRTTENKPSPLTRGVDGWRTLLQMPTSKYPNLMNISYQGDEFTVKDFQMLRKYVEMMLHIYGDDDKQRSDNTDDEFGWWKDRWRE